MRKLTVLAAAFAAGVTTFAAHAEVGAALAEKQAAIEAAFRTTASKARVGHEDATAEERTKFAAGMAAATGRAGAAGSGDAQAKVKGALKEGAGAENSGDRAAKETGSKAKQAAAALAAKKSPAGRYGTIIQRYASTYGVPVTLAEAVIQIESNYRPDALGSAGEVGLMQIKPATARMMGYSGSNDGLFHPETNIKFGMKYLGKAHRLGGGTICGTILKYNAGHAAKRMNPVSSAYCSKVKRHLAGT